MSTSWNILNALKDDLAKYVEDNKEAFELEKFEPFYSNVSYTPSQLQEQQRKGRFTDFHIGLYELALEDIVYIDAGKYTDFAQQYEISIFKHIAKEGGYDEEEEMFLMNMKDAVINWINGLQPSGATGGKLLTIQQDDGDTPIREDFYCSMNIQLQGRRCGL